MNYKRLFLNWLESKGIRKNFLYNCCTGEAVWNINRINCHPITYVWTLHPRCYILDSFRWHSTLEDESFWYRYHLQWIEYLDKYQSTH